jgi:type VI secretion system protein ImpE
MSAEENVKAGRLQQALDDLQADVKKRPADGKLRVFLFQLLAVMGQRERALTQLKVASDLDPSTVSMLQTYERALAAEAARGEVFAGRATPTLFGEPAEWMALLVQALKLVADGQLPAAKRLRDQAFEAAPTTAGKIDGKDFEWIADADPRLGPILETVLNGRYTWIPFARLSKIQIEKPVDLRDIAWMPATVTFTNGGETVAFFPTRYPGSEASSDPRVVMARSTEWIEKDPDTQLGLGQRLFATDQGEFPIMDVREIQLAGDGSENTTTGQG